MSRRIELPGADALFGEDGKGVPSPSAGAAGHDTPAPPPAGRARTARGRGSARGRGGARRATPAPVENPAAVAALLDAQAQVAAVAAEISSMREAVDATAEQAAALETAAAELEVVELGGAPASGRTRGRSGSSGGRATPARGRTGGGDARRTAARRSTSGASRAGTAAPTPAVRRGRRVTGAGDVMTRLELVERSLVDLPIDSLIGLRDGIEELLAADSLDAAAVERLLATVSP